MLALLAAGAHTAPAAAPKTTPAPPKWGKRGGKVPEQPSAVELTRLRDAAVAALHRGAAFLMRMQARDGDWPQQHISGVFNQNCMITYANYRNIFPIWALGMYRRCVLLGEPADAPPAAVDLDPN
jgi:Squalene-hopene cyclase C-terminal domain